MTEQFKQDVDHGLSSDPKTLPSKYFYDEIGDDLFVQIMNMPEYYLTRAEMEIFKTKTHEIIAGLQLSKQKHFELIELGAGDGTKTVELLKVLMSEGYDFDYLPVDISRHALDGLEKSLKQALPYLNVKPQQGDYFDILSSLKANQSAKVILFLGSNIGNMNDKQAAGFIYRLGSNLLPEDKLFLGVDLIKSRDIVLPAYNDLAGITSAFNVNLLHRINKELGGDFDLDCFVHAPEYEEVEGIAKSYLKSTKAQTVSIAALNKSFEFESGEKIHTEISRKYNDEVLKEVIGGTDFIILDRLTDANGYFADYILKRQ